MNRLRLLCHPHRLLLCRAEPVAAVDAEVRRAAGEMMSVMGENRGIGLAGNQVGLLKRIVVIGRIPDVIDEPLVLVNPVITATSGWLVEEEGCLSLPSESARVGRFRRIEATFRDLSGAEMKIEVEGLVARIIQHETDHLDGILYPRRLSLPARRRFMRRYMTEKKQAANNASEVKDGTDA